MKKHIVVIDRYEVEIEVDTISEPGYADCVTYSTGTIRDIDTRKVIVNPGIIDKINIHLGSSSLASLLEAS
jgi:hypothetical protein